METKEKNVLNPELKEAELDEVSGGIIPDFQPVDLIYDPEPGPYLDRPDSVDGPGHPDKKPKFF